LNESYLVLGDARAAGLHPFGAGARRCTGARMGGPAVGHRAGGGHRRGPSELRS